MALNSGTVEADILIYLKYCEGDISSYKINKSYITSISSLLGALIGSILYKYIGYNIYIVSLFFYIISIFVIFKFNLDLTKIDNKRESVNFISFIIKIFNDILALFKKGDFKYFFILISITPIYLQIFYQYWQVLYISKNIDSQFFGVVYLIFYLCNIIATKIYEEFKGRIKFIYILFISIIVNLIVVNIDNSYLFFLFFPLNVILFNVYSVDININFSKALSINSISSSISLMGTIINLISILVIYIISYFINIYSIEIAYMLAITVFYLLSIIVMLNKKISSEIKS